MPQAGVSRAKAVEALKTNDRDIVNAIMEVTMYSKTRAARKQCGALVWNCPLRQHLCRPLFEVFSRNWKLR
eukprot:7312590-Prymnesium_polylepis.1